jgi:transcriptional regulator with XRE-family HTH domain
VSAEAEQDITPQELGLRLKQLREAHGWSRDTLAERSGVSVSTIERWELGTVDPLRNARGIASALGLSLAGLLSTADDVDRSKLGAISSDLDELALRARALLVLTRQP